MAPTTNVRRVETQVVLFMLVIGSSTWAAAQAPTAGPAKAPATLNPEIIATGNVELYPQPGPNYRFIEKATVARDGLRFFLQRDRTSLGPTMFSKVLICDRAGKEQWGWVKLAPTAPPLREPVPAKCAEIPPPLRRDQAGLIGGVIGALAEAPPPPPPAAVAPLRIAGNIAPPRKIKDVPPAYPPIAQSARVQGVVLIEAIIDPNGKVTAARVLRSIPLLDAAALDAVRQWEFEPTLLDGVRMPVVMTVTVQFTLSDKPETPQP